ncbi:autotransporter outer membrane beta-barrel domain-containing protein [Motiliproteus sp. SC1-56]|uniref:autotransporter outer membrane beta-barrel domain-containing protein n=1 Tax=Motiliproteus sp. SC1-56 TaxID=2799565 RepID=UPI001A8E347C
MSEPSRPWWAFPALISLCGVSGAEPFPAETALRLGVGVSQHEFDWSIAGNLAGSDPNILSELIWRDVQMVELEAGLRLNLGKAVEKPPFFVLIEGCYGWIYDGDNRDSDFLADNREQEFLRTENRADDGASWHLSLALGVDFLPLPRLRLSPYLGYGYRELALVITDGNQTLNTLGEELGPFAGLDSTYDATWRGPFLGIGAVFAYSERWQWFAEARYSWDDDYSATADWNLRPDFAHPESFVQDTRGSGLGLELGAAYRLAGDDPARLRLTLSRQRWRGAPGLDTVFFADGGVTRTRLNGVDWSRTALVVSYQRSF